MKKGPASEEKESMQIKRSLFQKKNISSLKEKRGFFGKAITKYVIWLKTASLLVVCWGRISGDLLGDSFFISNTGRGWEGVISNPI